MILNSMINKELLQLIINNDNAINDMNRLLLNSGNLYLIASEIAKSKGEIGDNQIRKLNGVVHEMRESITKFAGTCAALAAKEL